MSSADDQEKQPFESSLQPEATLLDPRASETEAEPAATALLDVNQPPRRTQFPMRPNDGAAWRYPSYWDEILEPRPFPPNHQHEQHLKPSEETKHPNPERQKLDAGCPTRANAAAQNSTDPTKIPLPKLLARIAAAEAAQAESLASPAHCIEQHPFQDEPATTASTVARLAAAHSNITSGKDGMVISDEPLGSSVNLSYQSPALPKQNEHCSNRREESPVLAVAAPQRTGDSNAQATVAGVASFFNTGHGCSNLSTLGSVVRPVSRTLFDLPEPNTHNASQSHENLLRSSLQSDHHDVETIKGKTIVSQAALLERQHEKQQVPEEPQNKQQELMLKSSEPVIDGGTGSVAVPTVKATVLRNSGRPISNTGDKEMTLPILGIPCAMMPPSVLVNILASEEQEMARQCPLQIQNRAALCSPVVAKLGGNLTTFRESESKDTDQRQPPSTKSLRLESPQHVLEAILKSRGYHGPTRIKAEEARYDCVPSSLQVASYGMELFRAIHRKDITMLSMLLSAGLSPNARNIFRDGVLDLVCKRSHYSVFHCLVSHAADLRVCDGNGRTPLHHTCWANQFSKEIAQTILQHDWHQWFIEDYQGQTPLEYVRKQNIHDWVEFLESNQDQLFPAGKKYPPFRGLNRVRTEVAFPSDTLTVTLAAAISSGELTPEAVIASSVAARNAVR